MTLVHQLGINGQVPQHRARMERFAGLSNEHRHRVLRFAGNNDTLGSIFGSPQIDLRRPTQRTIRVPLSVPVTKTGYADLLRSYLNRFDKALSMPAEALAPTFGYFPA